MMEQDNSLSDCEFDYEMPMDCSAAPDGRLYAIGIKGRLHEKRIREALYVQPPQRPIDFNTVPDDGNEFIHKSRLIESGLDFRRSEIEDSSSSESEDDEGPRISQLHLRKTAAKFSRLANDVKIRREWVKNTYPQSYVVPLENEMDSCIFCLGSAKCLEIYNCGPRPVAEGHLPLFSIVIHLKQWEIFKLLRYTLKWFKTIGMEEDLGRWFYALIACVIKPLTDMQEKFLTEYFDDLKMHLQECDEDEDNRVRILMSILENYFVLKATKHDGEYLNKISKLRWS